ncbi:MAG: hypothetical protein GY720_20745 [bacterium]|nr:hypothetical protein [bacterium]
MARLPAADDGQWPSLALAAAVLGRQNQDHPELVGLLDREEPLSCRLAALCGRSLLGDSDVIGFLIELLTDDLPPIGRWMEGATQAIVTSAIAVHTGWLDLATVDAFRTPLHAVSWYQAAWLAEWLLYAALGSNIAPDSSRDLSAEQRAVLQLLLDHGAWHVNGGINSNWSGSLRNALLPSDRESMEQYLSGASFMDCIAPGLRDHLADLRRGSG